MLEINFLDGYREARAEELAPWMKWLFGALGYSIVKESEKLLLLQKASPYYKMIGSAALINDNKEGLAFAAVIKDEEGRTLACDEFSRGIERELFWARTNPQERDITLYACAVMESYLSGATNIKPIMALCSSLKRPGVKKPSHSAKIIANVSEAPLEARVDSAETEDAGADVCADYESADAPAETAKVQPDAQDAPALQIAIEYKMVYEAPAEISTSEESMLACLISREFHLPKRAKKAFATRLRMSEDMRIAYDAWTAEFKKKCYVTIFEANAGDATISPVSGEYRQAEAALLSAFGISRKRFAEIEDIVLHAKFPEFYKNKRVPVNSDSSSKAVS